MDYQIRQTIESNGDFHATFYNIKKDDLDYITKSSGIIKSGISDNLGYAKLNSDKDTLIQVKAYDKTSFNGYQIKLKEGKFPTNNKEIVLSENIISKIDKKIGDTITLDIGKRVNENGEDTSPWKGENETLKDTKSESFKIVGIINKPGFEYKGGILTGITYLDINKESANDNVNVSNMYKNEISEESKIAEELKNINGIKNIAVDNDYGISLNIKEKDINKKYENLIENYYTKEKVGNEYIYDFNKSNLKLPGDLAIKNINLKDGSFDKEKAIKENGVILIRKSYYEEKGKKGEVVLTDYNVGDTIDAYVTNYDEKTDKDIKTNIKLKVMAITDDLIPGSYNYNYMGLDFITYSEVGKKLGFKPLNGSMYISTDKKDNTIKAIKEVANKNGFDLINEVEEAKIMEQSIMAMQVFVYGFIIVISLVSVTNIVNTISTNINLRKRELAIIKSIGVTPGGFNKMICLKGLLYGILSLLYGLPIGIGIVILMNSLLGDVIQFGVILPWGGIIICIIGIFIITFISSYIPMRKINKENIIENIRQESI